jgi:hypothetical protein
MARRRRPEIPAAGAVLEPSLPSEIFTLNPSLKISSGFQSGPAEDDLSNRPSNGTVFELDLPRHHTGDN